MGHRPRRLDGSYGLMIPGPGVAAGGLPGQILYKTTAIDYETHWDDLPDTYTKAEVDAIVGGISAGAAVWGTITGTLSVQTDLQAALNGKAATAHSHGVTDISGTLAEFNAACTDDNFAGINANNVFAGDNTFPSGKIAQFNNGARFKQDAFGYCARFGYLEGETTGADTTIIIANTNFYSTIEFHSGVGDNVGVAKYGQMLSSPSLGLYFDFPGSVSYRSADGVTTYLAVASSGATFSVPVICPAATTAIPSARLPHGAAPSSPTDGDIWTTTAGLFVRINGATVGPLSAGGGGGTTTNPITFNNSDAGSGSGVNFDGSVARTISSNTIGALNKAGGTMTGTLTLKASAAGGAGINNPHGAAPTTPNNGDIWTTTSGLFVRINGATVGPLTATAAPSGSITASGYTMTTARLLGRTTASTGAIEEISIGGNLTLSAGSLNLSTTAALATGVTAVLQSTGDNSTKVATTSFVQQELAAAKRRMMPIMAAAMTPNTTNGPSAGSVELTTNKNMLVTQDYDTTTAESAQFCVPMPESWNEGTITFKPLWTAASGSGGVAWGLQGVAISDDDTMDVAFGTQVVVTDTFITANDLHVGAESTAVTISGSPAAGDLVNFKVQRVVSNGSDTLAVDAKLIGIRIYYTENAKDDT